MNKESKQILPVNVIIFFVFLFLKLTDNIDWSWWWVISPLLIPGLFILLTLLLVSIWIPVLYLTGNKDKVDEILKKKDKMINEEDEEK